jgi:PAS domain S-box-containing protein
MRLARTIAWFDGSPPGTSLCTAIAGQRGQGSASHFKSKNDSCCEPGDRFCTSDRSEASSPSLPPLTFPEKPEPTAEPRVLIQSFGAIKPPGRRFETAPTDLGLYRTTLESHLQGIPDRQGHRFPAFLTASISHTFLGGTMRRTSVLPALGWELIPNGTALRGSTVLIGGAFTLAYFLATLLGLALFTQPLDVVPFWPASGIAAGILIVSNRRTHPILLMGVMAGAVTANLLCNRSLFTSIGSGVANAGEAVLVAWLLQRWFGPAFAFSDLSRIAGFLAAAAIAAAVSALAGTASVSSLHAAAPLLDVWCAWFLSGTLGIIVVGPLVIELARALRAPLPRRETVEGLMVLVLLALVAIYVYTQPPSWISFNPHAFTLPLLLWLAARCPPPLAIAGAFIVSICAIGTTILGIGRMSAPVMPIMERVHVVQTTVMMTTLYTLVLVALFTDRRSHAAQLERSNQQLRHQETAFRQLLGALPAAIHTTDTAGRITYCNNAAVDLWGVSPELGKDKCADLGRLYYPNGTLVPPDQCPTKKCLVERQALQPEEVVFERPDGRRIPIVPYPAPLTDARGDLVGVVSMKIDVTERKQAEQALAERNAQLDLAHRAARVGSYTYDIKHRTMRILRASAAIYGLPHSTMEISTQQWGKRVHRDDVARLRAEQIRAFKEKRREVVSEFRFVRPGGEIRWVEARSLVAYDDNGRAERMTGVYIDVTERRKTEEYKSLLIAELDHRVKNVLACVAAVAQRSRECSRSADEFLEVLNGRINSLANTHALLSRSSWEGVGLGELVRSELAPCASNGNSLIEGPDIVVAAEATQPLAMVLHELTTNATKYGALSSRRGRVSVCWRRKSSRGSQDHLSLEWRESGGPPIAIPGPPGYGSSVIRELIPYELGGSVHYDFAPEGVRCRLEIPAKWLSTRARSRGKHAAAVLSRAFS